MSKGMTVATQAQMSSVVYPLDRFSVKREDGTNRLEILLHYGDEIRIAVQARDDPSCLMHTEIEYNEFFAMMEKFVSGRWPPCAAYVAKKTEPADGRKQ